MLEGLKLWRLIQPSFAKTESWSLDNKAQHQLDDAQTEVEQWQDTIERRAKRFAAGRPVTMTQGYAAYLRMHGVPRVRSASLSPQVTTPQGG